MQSSGVFFPLKMLSISLMMWSPLTWSPRTQLKLAYFMSRFEIHSLLPHENTYSFLSQKPKANHFGKERIDEIWDVEKCAGFMINVQKSTVFMYTCKEQSKNERKQFHLQYHKK